MKNNLMKSIRIAATAVMFLGLSWNSQAQTFPDREVSLIVNYGAGGTTDVASRALAQGMEKSLGKPIIVKNRTGA